MPDRKSSALYRALAPAATLALTLRDGSKKKLKLSFDFNVGAMILEKSGLSLTEGSEFWKRVGHADPAALRASFWAALTPYQPEYANENGIEIAGSLITEDNAHEIIEALWSAYLLYVPEWRREILIQNRKDIEARNKAEREEEGADPAPLVKAEKSSAARASANSSPLPDSTLA